MTAALTLTYGSLNLTSSPYLVPWGSDTGAPENEVIPLATFIQDGDLELSSRAGNRTIQFDVLIEAASLTLMATAEANLVAETEKVLNTLKVDWGDGAPAAVYDIFRGQVTLARDDDGEIARLRRYTVTVRALPYPRSVLEIVTPALSGGGTTTNNVDTQGATTGWTGSINGVGATVTNAVGPPTTNSVTQSSISGPINIVMTKTVSVTTSSLKYLIIDWAHTTSGLTDLGFTATGDGITLTKVAEGASPLTVGYTRTWFYVSAASLGVLALAWVSNVDFPGTRSRTLTLDNIAISDVKPGIGTTRQQLRTVAVVGSARTQGALAIESTTAALGDSLVYVYPNDKTTSGYVPALRQFRTAGNTVSADSAQMSGSTESITTPGVTYQIPVVQLPVGNYVLLARVATSGGGTPTITWTTRTVLGGTNLTPTTTGSRQITTTTAYQIVTLARFSLPSVDLGPASPAVQSLNLLASSTCTIDEAWLFNTTTGQLIQVACGTGSGSVGGSARRIFIEPAVVATPRPTLLIGHSADRSDAYHPATLTAWQQPQFSPSVVNVFTGTSNATDSTVTLRHFPRWHTNASS